MKLGISGTALSRDWTVDKMCAVAKEMGYEGIEFWLTPSGIVNMESTPEDIQQIKETAEKYGLELYSLACAMYFSTSLTAESTEVRDKAKAILKKQIDVAHQLGCETILVVPGAVGINWIRNFEVVSYDIAYERALEWIEEFKAYAEEKNVVIAMENVGNKFLLSPLEMRDFIDKADSDYIGAYFDVGNIMSCGYPDQWIRILGNRIKKVHLKDYDRNTGNEVALLAGDVDYPAVMAALKEIHYDGWLTSEYSFKEEERMERLQQTIDAMKKITENK